MSEPHRLFPCIRRFAKARRRTGLERLATRSPRPTATNPRPIRERSNRACPAVERPRRAARKNRACRSFLVALNTNVFSIYTQPIAAAQID